MTEQTDARTAILLAFVQGTSVGTLALAWTRSPEVIEAMIREELAELWKVSCIDECCWPLVQQG